MKPPFFLQDHSFALCRLKFDQIHLLCSPYSSQISIILNSKCLIPELSSFKSKFQNFIRVSTYVCLFFKTECRPNKLLVPRCRPLEIWADGPAAWHRSSILRTVREMIVMPIKNSLVSAHSIQIRLIQKLFKTPKK